MLLDSAAAKALFVVIMMSTQRADEIEPQRPLQVVDRGDSWLVKGTPFTRRWPPADYCMTYMIFRKDTAEVTGIMSAARMIPTDAESVRWHTIMTPQQYADVFGPPTRFEPNGILDMYSALYGGLVNTPEDAVDYAFVLMQTDPALAHISKAALHATEHNKVWSVTMTVSGSAEAQEILRLSRSDGKVLSGRL